MIEASLERVWSLVAKPGFWVAEEASVAGTVAREGGGTRLRVVESGFAALNASDELREQTVRFNTSGWAEVFEVVGKRAEQSSV